MSAKDIILAAAGQGSSAETDPYFANTTLLLQGDVSNPDLSYNAFSDASGNNVNILPVGDAIGSSFSPYNTSWGVQFGASQYIDTPAINFSTNAFCMEGWFNYSQVSTGVMPIFGASNGGGGQAKTLIYFNNNALILDIDGSGNTISVGSASSFCVPGKWFHLALVRNSSGSTAFFVDGARKNTPVSVGDRSGVTAAFAVGRTETSLIPSGNTVLVSNFRVTNGFTPYDPTLTTLTVPTSQLTNVSNTVRRMCMFNRFIDQSPTPVTLSLSGSPKITGASPFLDTDTTTGSGYFDGTTDYLSLPSSSEFNFGTGNFTIEFWYYFTINYQNAFDINYEDFQFYHQNNGSGYQWWCDIRNTFAPSGNRGISSSAGSTTLNEWHHVALVKNGDTGYIYIDGVQRGSGSLAGVNINVTSSGAPVWIGRRAYSNGSTDGYYVNGHISDYRVTKAAVYTSNFTPPTAPVPVISNISFLALQTRGAVRNIGFRDESEYNHLITKVGNCAQGTFSPFSQEEGKWGVYLDGLGDYLTAPSSGKLAFGSGNDLCIETWYYASSAASTYPVIWDFNGSWATNVHHLCDRHSSVPGKFTYWVNNYGGSALLTSTTTVVNSTWYHLAVTRSGSTWRLFVNGVLESTATWSGSVDGGTSSTFILGTSNPGSNDNWLHGYISNMRVVKGRAVYTSAFTPPTTPLGVTSGGGDPPQGTETSLLICQSNRFKDNSINPLTVTPYGNFSVQPFSPFAPSAAYDPDVNGGSGYFDKSGDYLQLAENALWRFGSGDFTIEAYLWVDDTDTTKNLAFHWNGTTGGTVTGSTNVPSYAWTHVAVTRTGTTMRFWVNGVEDSGGAKTVSSTIYNNNDPLMIGRGADHTGGVSNQDICHCGEVGGTSNKWYFYLANATGGSFKGYMALFRISNVVRYSGTFTPPTALTSDTNTSLLLNFTNAGVIDATGKNVIETSGNAHVETSVKKYGTGSMEFDGTGDYLVLPNSPNTQVGAGPYTIEMWVNTTQAWGWLVFDADNDTGIRLGINVNGTQGLGADGLVRLEEQVSNVGYTISSTTRVDDGNWHHVAISRAAGTPTKLFIDGVLEATNSTVANLTNPNRMFIGTRGSLAYFFKGSIDDLRITKGVARYTTTFTPPTKSLPNQ